jgi:glycosyltransferase involved in cell wall biosynthesis
MFYTHALVAGGAERIWAHLATAFARAGHRVVFAVKNEGEGVRHLLDASIPLHVLGPGFRPAVAGLADLVARERPAVVLSAVGGSNLEAALAVRRARVPARLVISYHGFAEWQTGKLSLATYAALPWLSRTAARTIAVSEGLRTTLVRRWGASPARTVRIYNPVHLPAQIEAAQSAAELLARPPTVLAVGRLVPDKSFDRLIAAFARVRLSAARLVILGEGPERARLEAEVARLGLSDRVTLAGQVEPWPHYAAARCFALTSRTESFANVVVEALAHGLPVVATRCGGPAEILDEGAFGALVPIGDEAAIAAAIEQALADPGDPTDRRHRAAAFSFEVGFAEYAKLIEAVRAEGR